MLRKIAIILFIAFVLISAKSELLCASQSEVSGVADAVDSKNIKSPRDDQITDAVDQDIIDTTINNRFNEVFKNFVDENGMVDYGHLRCKRSVLISLMRELRSIEVEEYLTWEYQEQVAFWVNAHNVSVLKLVIDNYPIKASKLRMIFYPAASIMQIKGFQTEYFITIMGREYNLKELEEYIVKLYEDPRIRFAISKGSFSSPLLRNEAYLGHILEKQIDDQIKKYLETPYGIEINNDDEIIYLSSLFSNHKEEFTKNYKTNEKYRTRDSAIRAYFNFIFEYTPNNKKRPLINESYEVKFMQYDWRLNDRALTK